MKNMLLVLVLFTGSLLSAQSNRFSTEADVKAKSSFQVGTTNGPGGENNTKDLQADDAPVAPIDDYLPLLVIIALGLISYVGYRQKQMS